MMLCLREGEGFKGQVAAPRNPSSTEVRRWLETLGN